MVEAFAVCLSRNLVKNRFAGCRKCYFDCVRSLASLLTRYHHRYHHHLRKKVACCVTSSRVLNSHSKITNWFQPQSVASSHYCCYLVKRTLSSIIVSSSEKSVDPSSCERFQSILTLSNNVFCLCRA